VLKYLLGIAESRGLKLICSTEKITIGAQKAINRAGFISANRILQFDFKKSFAIEFHARIKSGTDYT
jgi:hypothetical protein